MSSDIDVDVLIVGAGPVGMLGGILASRHGLSSLVVERRDGPQTSPAAHVVNARTYEICRQAGLDMNAIDAACRRPEGLAHEASAAQRKRRGCIERGTSLNNRPTTGSQYEYRYT